MALATGLSTYRTYSTRTGVYLSVFSLKEKRSAFRHSFFDLVCMVQIPRLSLILMLSRRPRTTVIQLCYAFFSQKNACFCAATLFSNFLRQKDDFLRCAGSHSNWRVKHSRASWILLSITILPFSLGINFCGRWRYWASNLLVQIIFLMFIVGQKKAQRFQRKWAGLLKIRLKVLYAGSVGFW